jgi:hypothetical protein
MNEFNYNDNLSQIHDYKYKIKYTKKSIIYFL